MSIKNIIEDTDPLQLSGTSFMFGLGLYYNYTFSSFDDTYLTPSLNFYSGDFNGNYLKDM